MATIRLFTYLVLLMVGGLLSCSDHPFQTAVTPGSTTNRLRVKTLTLDLPNNQAKVSSFRYDGQGRLSSIITFQTPDSTVAPVEFSSYQYDAQNRLSRFQRYVNIPSSGTGDPGSTRTESLIYTYNTAGQTSGIAYFVGDENALNLITRYNSANQLEGSRIFASGGGFSFESNNSFTFTGSNLTTLSNNTRFTARSVDVGSSSGTITYTYDNKVNPFYGTFVIPSPYPSGFFNPRTGPGFNNDALFGGLFNVFNLSPNNVLSANTTTMYQYEYNSANLPTLRRTIANNVIVQTLRFEYEFY